MRKYQINCPLITESVPEHDRYKDELLLKIKQSGGEKIIGGVDCVTSIITSGDYFHENDRSYEPLFFTMAKDTIQKLIKEFFDVSSTEFKCEPTIPWYQQYHHGDTHSWHDHAGGSTLSVIYYLELPEGTPGTEFIDPYTGRVHRPRVKEGDVIVFPSFVRHRSPENKSDQRKTIISLNYV